MAEYIEREDLQKFLEHRNSTYCAGCTDIDCLACVEQWVAEIPAADVAPVLYGKWKILTGNVDPRDNWLFCSECGLTVTDRNKTNYCPNCGAKMDGETND